MAAGWLSAAPSPLVPGVGVFGFAAHLRLSLLSDCDVFPLSTKIFLTFTVAEEGMEILVEAVSGSERP